jgi:hypothetical protein
MPTVFLANVSVLDHKDLMIRTVIATRYITPLREGGSLPALVEADDGALYVMKFTGAGQGVKALIAELVAGEIARGLGLLVPELVFMELDGKLSRSEPDPEIQDLLRSSEGLNLGMRYLPSAFAFNQLLKPPPSPDVASAIVWFDAYATNVDRTPRNVNLLLWQNKLWLIDHGAALYFHHDWANYLERSKTPFPLIKQHTLLSFAAALPQANARLVAALTPEFLAATVDLIPDHWLGNEPMFANRAEHRQAYLTYLLSRLQAAPIFLEEATYARAQLL